MLFLIDYDRKQCHIAELRRFDKSEQSEADRERLEREIRYNRESIDHEVVILEAENEEAIRKTHRRYFETFESIAAGFVGAVQSRS